MGYSNNKWRKILTILMIINLCFILFARFSRVFGAWFTGDTFDISGVYLDNTEFTLTGVPVLPTGCDSYFLIDKYYNNRDFWFFAWDSSTSCCFYNPNTGGVSLRSLDNLNNGASLAYYTSRFSGNQTWYTYEIIEGLIGPSASDKIYSNDNIYNYSTFNSSDISLNTILFNKPTTVKYPELLNTLSELQSLDFETIQVNSYSWSDKEFDILFYDRNVKNVNTTDGLYPNRVITLEKNSTYFQRDISTDNSIYYIPIDEIGLNLYVGGTYEIRFAEKVPIDPSENFGATFYYDYLGDSVRFTISSNVTQDKIDALNQEIRDTTEKKYHEETINSMNNINNNINNVNNALTNTTPDSSISSDIDNSLNFDNQNSGLNNLNSGFFSRLTTMLSNLLGYNLAEDTSVSLPLPNSDKSIVLHSKDIYDNVTGALRLIINAFWVYIFTFYMWKFINKIYIAVSTGNILDTFSSSGEAITNDML